MFPYEISYPLGAFCWTIAGCGDGNTSRNEGRTVRPVLSSAKRTGRGPVDRGRRIRAVFFRSRGSHVSSVSILPSRSPPTGSSPSRGARRRRDFIVTGQVGSNESHRRRDRRESACNWRVRRHTRNPSRKGCGRPRRRLETGRGPIPTQQSRRRRGRRHPSGPSARRHGGAVNRRRQRLAIDDRERLRRDVDPRVRQLHRRGDGSATRTHRQHRVLRRTSARARISAPTRGLNSVVQPTVR